MVQKNQFLTGEQVIAGLERVQVYNGCDDLDRLAGRTEL